MTTGMQMLAMRPCIPACKQVLGSTSALSAFGRALSTRTGFGSCSKPTSVGPMTSSNCKRVIVRAMSQRGSQGLPIDLTGKLNVDVLCSKFSSYIVIDTFLTVRFFLNYFLLVFCIIIVSANAHFHCVDQWICFSPQLHKNNKYTSVEDGLLVTKNLRNIKMK